MLTNVSTVGYIAVLTSMSTIPPGLSWVRLMCFLYCTDTQAAQQVNSTLHHTRAVWYTYKIMFVTVFALGLTRFIPFTITPGFLRSLSTLLMMPVCPASFPALMITLSPLRSFHCPLENIDFMAFLCRPIPFAPSGF